MMFGFFLQHWLVAVRQFLYIQHKHPPSLEWTDSNWIVKTSLLLPNTGFCPSLKNNRLILTHFHTKCYSQKVKVQLHCDDISVQWKHLCGDRCTWYVGNRWGDSDHISHSSDTELVTLILGAHLETLTDCGDLLYEWDIFGFTICSFCAAISILRHCSQTQSHWDEAWCQSSVKINCKWRQHICPTGVIHVSLVMVSVSPKNTFNTFEVFTTCVIFVCTDMDAIW